jgi:hypothetical protein
VKGPRPVFEARKSILTALLQRAPFPVRLRWDALKRVHYGYGTYHAALQAQALGIPRITVIEIGVAAGNGLLALEDMARAVHAETGVQADVYGFDTGEGLPGPRDHRDLPYVWREGHFRLDARKLRSRLTVAQLVLGDVGVTIAPFLRRPGLAPIGFVAFDLDYYSSTAAALVLLDAPHPLLLPRVFCYFDDLIGDDWELHCEHAGELLAIREYNDAHRERKISRINGLSWKRPLAASWNDEMYVLHSFSHPLYNEHVHPNRDWQLRLPARRRGGSRRDD